MFHCSIPWLPKSWDIFPPPVMRQFWNITEWNSCETVTQPSREQEILKSNKLQKLANSEIWCLIHVFQASHNNQWVFQLPEVSFHGTCSLCWLWRGGSLSFFPSFFRFEWTTRNICNVIISLTCFTCDAKWDQLHKFLSKAVTGEQEDRRGAGPERVLWSRMLCTGYTQFFRNEASREVFKVNAPPKWWLLM